MPKHKILVIGSKDHQRADCFNWLEPFPNIEEYDSLIINMRTLSQETYDNIGNKLRDMIESISTIIDTGREIFCILNCKFTHWPPPMVPGKPHFKSINLFPGIIPTNYEWLPAPLVLDNRKSGDQITLCNNLFKGYFGLIHKWFFEIGFYTDNYSNVPTNYLNTIEPIAVNKSEKVIAGNLVRANDRKKLLNGEKRGMVHLLPPPEEALSFHAIECIIDIILGAEEKVEAPWRKDIDILLDHPLKENLKKKQHEVNQIQKDVMIIQEQISKLVCYRDLITETGDSLEQIVHRTLMDIGIATTKTKPGFPADLVNKEVAIEVTGIKGGVSVDSNKVTQTGRYIQNYRKQEKVILIVNTYMGIPPKDRINKRHFSPEIEAYLRSLSVSYLTTQTLFELWKDVIVGKKKKDFIKEKILTTIGEVKS